ncbi:hypothetical protein NXX35_12845 [Bacteroides xylanisolvens]|nr:hypothetical protein NXX35_12845 [Bacteroides xylanisolvens]
MVTCLTTVRAATMSTPPRCMVFHTSSVLSETSSNSPGRVSEEVVNPTCSASTPEGALSSWGRKILGRRTA